MAKLTYEEVAEKADLLVQQNMKPTVKAVQALLGGRSTDDIAVNLKKWIQANSDTVQKSWRMPDSVSAAVHLEMERRTVEVETRANESRALISQQTDALLQEVRELHDVERSAWSRQQVELQTDAEIGRRDSLESVQLRAQLRLLELDLQTRTVQLDASVQKIKGLEDSAASVQNIHDQAIAAEIDAKVQRKFLEELKELHRTNRNDWNEERIQLKKDAEVGRRNSAENEKLREQMLKLEVAVQSANTRYDELAEEQEALKLAAASVQESENRMRVAEASVKDLQKERDNFKVLAETNAQMLAPYLDHMEADSAGPMNTTAAYLPIPATLNGATYARPDDLQKG